MPDVAGARAGEPLQRVSRLEHQYAIYCDSGYDANGMGSLVVENPYRES